MGHRSLVVKRTDSGIWLRRSRARGQRRQLPRRRVGWPRHVRASRWRGHMNVRAAAATRVTLPSPSSGVVQIAFLGEREGGGLGLPGALGERARAVWSELQPREREVLSWLAASEENRRRFA